MHSAHLARRILGALLPIFVLAQASSCCCLLGGATSPPVTPFEIDEEQADALRERVQMVKAEPGPFEIVLTDWEMTSYIVGLAQSGAGEFPAKDMKLQFNDGYLEIWATFIEVAPSDLPVYVRATVEAVDGDVVFHIKQANAGPFPVPGAMRELIAASLSETLAELDFALDVESVDLRAGEIVLRGAITGSIPDLPIHVVN